MATFFTYDPDDTDVPNRGLSYLTSKPVSHGNSLSDFMQDADVSGLSDVPAHYWKKDGSSVVEMDATEKGKIDKKLKLNDYADKDFETIIYEVKQSIGSQEQADRINVGIKMYGYLAELQLRGVPDYAGFESVIDMAVADPDCPLTADDGTMIKLKLPSY